MNQRPTTIDRLPPHSPEAEQAVLGCLLMDPNGCCPVCIERIVPTVFYDLRHQTIYSAIVIMYDLRKPIDLVTLQSHLKDNQTLESVGGISYLTALSDMVPSAANIRYYLDIVEEKAMLRRMISTCTDAVTKVFDFEGDADRLLDDVERDVMKIRETRKVTENPTSKDLVRRVVTAIEDMERNKGVITGLTSGFVDLDKITAGLHPGEMIVIAARPSQGKTALAMNIAEHVCMEAHLPVGVFSLEMTSESLMMRMLCSRARVNIRNVREGFLAERDFPKITKTAGNLSTASLWIDDSSGLSILQLRAKARRMQQKHGIRLLVIDYLQLLHSTSRRAESRQQEIADISSGIKSLAKELKIPIIVLSQLNRDLEKEKGRPPRLSDLRESGAIEQDADVVAMLYKVKKGEKSDEDNGNGEDSIPVNLLIPKQRNGPTGIVHLTFIKSYVRFESAAKVEAEDTPSLPYADA